MRMLTTQTPTSTEVAPLGTDVRYCGAHVEYIYLFAFVDVVLLLARCESM